MSDTFIGVKQLILKLKKEGFLMRVVDILPPSKHGTSLRVKVRNLAYIVSHSLRRAHRESLVFMNRIQRQPNTE